MGADSLGFSASGSRVRKKVSGRTKAEVRDKLRELHHQVDSRRTVRYVDAGRALGSVIIFADHNRKAVCECALAEMQ